MKMQRRTRKRVATIMTIVMSCFLLVTHAQAAWEQITIELESGQKVKLKTNFKATFKSSNKKVATVSKKGIVKGKKPGKAKITIISKKNKNKRMIVNFRVTYCWEEINSIVELTPLAKMTPEPMDKVTTETPTVSPTVSPMVSEEPTLTANPTNLPTSSTRPIGTTKPTGNPIQTTSPTALPSVSKNPTPTVKPTDIPISTTMPTVKPTDIPTSTTMPTIKPTDIPTKAPATAAPTRKPDIDPGDEEGGPTKPPSTSSQTKTVSLLTRKTSEDNKKVQVKIKRISFFLKKEN